MVSRSALGSFSGASLENPHVCRPFCSNLGIFSVITFGLSCVPDGDDPAQSSNFSLSLSVSTRLRNDNNKTMYYKQRALSSIGIPVSLTGNIFCGLFTSGVCMCVFFTLNWVFFPSKSSTNNQSPCRFLYP